MTVLLFARSGLYAERAQRPGPAADRLLPVPGHGRGAVFAVVNGEQYSSYYIFYGTLALRDRLRRASPRYLYERVTGVLLRAAGYRRRAVLVGSGKHIEDVAHALTDEVHAPVEMVGFISLTPRPDNGLRSLGRIDDLPEVLDAHRVQEVIIADPDFPQERAVELVDQCHRRGVTVRDRAVDDGDPRPPRGVRARARRCRCSSCARRSSTASTTCVKRIVRLRRRALLLILRAQPAAAGDRDRRDRSPRAGRCSTARSGRASAASRSPASSSARCARDADQMQADLESLNEATGPLFKIRDDPRLTRVGALPAPLLARRAAAAVQRAAGQMSLVGPRPLPQRDFDQLEDWHKKRYLVLPGITGLWQVSGRSELDFDDLVRLDFLYLERWSVGLDLTILLKTIPAVLTRRGAF